MDSDYGFALLCKMKGSNFVEVIALGSEIPCLVEEAEIFHAQNHIKAGEDDLVRFHGDERKLTETGLEPEDWAGPFPKLTATTERAIYEIQRAIILC